MTEEQKEEGYRYGHLIHRQTDNTILLNDG